jgi:hypothetical protein
MHWHMFLHSLLIPKEAGTVCSLEIHLVIRIRTCPDRITTSPHLVITFLYVFCGTGLTSACLSVISQFLPGISQILAEKVRKQEKIATRTKEWME